MDLRRQLRVFRASWPVLVAGALVAAAVAFVVFSAQPRSYEARATLIVGR